MSGLHGEFIGEEKNDGIRNRVVNSTNSVCNWSIGFCFYENNRGYNWLGSLVSVQGRKMSLLIVKMMIGILVGIVLSANNYRKGGKNE